MQHCGTYMHNNYDVSMHVITLRRVCMCNLFVIVNLFMSYFLKLYNSSNAEQSLTACTVQPALSQVTVVHYSYSAMSVHHKYQYPTVEYHMHGKRYELHAGRGTHFESILRLSVNVWQVLLSPFEGTVFKLGFPLPEKDLSIPSNRNEGVVNELKISNKRLMTCT